MDRLLADRLEDFDVDLETPSFRKELVLTSLLDVGFPAVTSMTLVMVTTLGDTTVTVVDAVRLCLIVAARSAVELMVFVET